LERVGIGSTVEVAYVEQEKEYEGKPYTARIVRNINEDIGNGVKNHRQQTQQTIPIKQEDNFGLRLAIHGMVNGLLAGGCTPAEVSSLLPELFGLEEDIEMRLSKPASLNVAEAKIKKANPQAFSDGSPVPEELPTIQVDEDTSTDQDLINSIPF
jgi:hypothetical protein